MKNYKSKFNFKYKQIIKESIDTNFFIQENILFVFMRESRDTDIFGLSYLRNLTQNVKQSFPVLSEIIKNQKFDIEPISNDEFEDGVYFQINGKDITAGIMYSLDNLSTDDIQALKDYLLNEGLSQGI